MVKETVSNRQIEVPLKSYTDNIGKEILVANFRYLGGGDFTGYVFCSTLEGVFVKAFEYVGGRYVGVANATPASRTKKLWQEHPELFEDVRIFRFQELPRLSQKTYTKSSDWGDDDWCDHGFPPGGLAVQGAIRVAVVLLTGVSMVCLRGAVLFVMAVESLVASMGITLRPAPCAIRQWMAGIWMK